MRLLKQGARGKDVEYLQTLLNRTGSRLDVDGDFGLNTTEAVRRFQRLTGLTADGIVGQQTWTILEARAAAATASTDAPRLIAVEDWLHQDTWDANTDRRIALLHPKIRSKIKELIIRLEREHGKTARIVSGLRTMQEQAALYAQGRSKPGAVVTNAKPGQSYHNFGLAIDLVEIKNGKALWDNPDWERIGAFGESLGFEWGGRWTSLKDLPHLQMTFGKSTGDLLALYNSGQRDGEYVRLG